MVTESAGQPLYKRPSNEIWHSASRCDCASPWHSRPMKSLATPRRLPGALSRLGSLVRKCKAGDGLSAADSVARGRPQGTVTPVRIKAAAAAT
jgi:hypothetical protein